MAEVVNHARSNVTPGGCVWLEQAGIKFFCIVAKVIIKNENFSNNIQVLRQLGTDNAI